MKIALLIAALLGLLAVAGWGTFEVSRSIGFQMSVHGWIALGLGVFFSLAIGVGLMALVFYSNRQGYDEPFRPDD